MDTFEPEELKIPSGINSRSGTRYIGNIPKSAGKIVGILNHNDRIIVACEYKIIELVE